MTAEKETDSEQQARLQLEGIKEMVAALQCDYDRLAELRQERDDWETEHGDARDWPDAPGTRRTGGRGRRVPGRRPGPRADRAGPAVDPVPIGLAHARRGADGRGRGIRNPALHRRPGLPHHRRARRVVRAADSPDRAPGLVHAVDGIRRHRRGRPRRAADLCPVLLLRLLTPPVWG